jgi:hypothetical protein
LDASQALGSNRRPVASRSFPNSPAFGLDIADKTAHYSLSREIGPEGWVFGSLFLSVCREHNPALIFLYFVFKTKKFRHCSDSNKKAAASGRFLDKYKDTITPETGTEFS